MEERSVVTIVKRRANVQRSPVCDGRSGSFLQAPGVNICVMRDYNTCALCITRYLPFTYTRSLCFHRPLSRLALCSLQRPSSGSVDHAATEPFVPM